MQESGWKYLGMGLLVGVVLGVCLQDRFPAVHAAESCQDVQAHDKATIEDLRYRMSEAVKELNALADYIIAHTKHEDMRTTQQIIIRLVNTRFWLTRAAERRPPPPPRPPPPAEPLPN